MTTEQPQPPRSEHHLGPLRGVLVTLASLADAATLPVERWGQGPYIIWFPALLLAAAAVMVHFRRLPLQIFVRAIWWQALILGLLLAVLGSHDERSCGAVMALASGAALLLVGRAGLAGQPQSRFAPIAYRGSLLLAIIMAMADAEALLLWGGFALESGDLAHSTLQVYATLGSAAVMILVVYGLYSLKVWGLVLNVLSNLLIAATAVAGLLTIPHNGEWALVATAGTQLLLLFPLLIALRCKTAPRPAGIPTWRFVLTSAVVALIMVTATASTVMQL